MGPPKEHLCQVWTLSYKLKQEKKLFEEIVDAYGQTADNGQPQLLTLALCDYIMNMYKLKCQHDSCKLHFFVLEQGNTIIIGSCVI